MDDAPFGPFPSNNQQQQQQQQQRSPTQHQHQHQQQQQQQRISAPYGHACANCAKAKCKCVSRPGPGPGPGAKCERCHRLGRECTPSPTVRKRGSTRRAAIGNRALSAGVGGGGGGGGGADGGTGTNSGGRRGSSDVGRTAQLEEKLDDLVSLLRSQAAASGHQGTAAAAASDGSAAASVVGGGGGGRSGPPPNQVPTPESTVSEDNMPRLRLKDMYPFAQLAGTAAANHVAVSACYQPPPGSAPPAVPDLDPVQAEECLKTFRENHLRFFPFVYLPPGATAEQVQRERPFLWLNIRALCCKSSIRQAALGQQIREIIGQQVLGQSERTMDLLLGLIGFLGWGMIQAMGRPIMAVFTGVATGMVSDLRLDKPPHFNPLKEAHAFKPYRFACPVPWTSMERTHEQRRAALAVYVISANNFYFLKTQIMRWTPHMEDALQKLSDEPEWPGDQVLAAIVRVFKVLEDFSHIQWSASDVGSRASAPKPTPMYYVKALRANLEEVRRSLPPALRENKIIQTYIYSAEAQINDLPLQSPGQSSPPGFVDFNRTECFELCVRATKQCLDCYFTFEPAEYIGFSMPMFLHYSRATQILYRLSLTDDPAWDRASVRHTVDLLAALVAGEAHFASVARAAGLESDGPDGGDMFTKGANALRATIPIWRASLEHVGAIPPSTATAAATTSATTAAGPGAGPGAVAMTMANSAGADGHARAAMADMMSAADAGMSEPGVGSGGGDVNATEFLPSAGAEALQDFMMSDFGEDPWITDFFTWESPRR